MGVETAAATDEDLWSGEARGVLEAVGDRTRCQEQEGSLDILRLGGLFIAFIKLGLKPG